MRAASSLKSSLTVKCCARKPLKDILGLAEPRPMATLVRTIRTIRTPLPRVH